MQLYLDMAATTPVSPRVADVVLQHMTDGFGNAGSRSHEVGQRAKRAVTEARATLATVVAASPEEVIFTSGATESNNLALLGLAAEGIRSGRRHIVSSATEHKAVLEPLEHLARHGFDVELLRPGITGQFRTEDILSRVRDDTLLVSLMHVNNETGVVQPIRQLADSLSDTLTLLHVDAAQSFAKVDIETLRGGIDLISLSGHKIGAPMGIGALVVRRRGWNRIPLSPLMYGGGQERKLRPGTLPVPLVVGLAEAARERLEDATAWEDQSQEFRDDLLVMVRSLGGVVNGEALHAAPHILNFSLPGADSEAIVLALKDAAAIATGSACTSASYTASHVLEAMGLEAWRTRGAVRFSWWGRPTRDLEPIRTRLAQLVS